jgi:hypothetical protein
MAGKEIASGGLVFVIKLHRHFCFSHKAALETSPFEAGREGDGLKHDLQSHIQKRL